MDYSLLINRKIIDVLIGDVKVYEDFTLPYLEETGALVKAVNEVSILTPALLRF